MWSVSGCIEMSSLLSGVSSRGTGGRNTGGRCLWPIGRVGARERANRGPELISFRIVKVEILVVDPLFQIKGDD